MLRRKVHLNMIDGILVYNYVNFYLINVHTYGLDFIETGTILLFKLVVFPYRHIPIIEFLIPADTDYRLSILAFLRQFLLFKMVLSGIESF